MTKRTKKSMQNVVDGLNTINGMLPEGFNSPKFERAKALFIESVAYAAPEMENHYWAALAQLCNTHLPCPEEGKVWREIKDMIWAGLKNSFNDDSDSEPGDVQSE